MTNPVDDGFVALRRRRPGRKHLWTAAVALMLSSCASGATVSGNPEGFGTARYTFTQYKGPTLVLDFGHGVEVVGRRKSRLVDCSTAARWCARGDLVKFSYAKDCSSLAAPVDERDQAGTFSLRQLQLPPDPHGVVGSGFRRILASEDQRSIVYEHDSVAGLLTIVERPDLSDLHAIVGTSETFWDQVFSFYGKPRTIWTSAGNTSVAPCLPASVTTTN